MTAAGLRASAVALAACLGCGGWQASSDPDAGAGASTGGTAGAGGEPGAGGAPRGLKVVGNQIHDAEGNRVVLRGVNRSGTEYQCVKNTGGVFDGPATEESVRAMVTWNINAVRVPLNESCWLDINGAPGRYSGENYKAVILDYIDLLHRNALVPILDLHWAAPGDELAAEVSGRGALRPLPNVDHSIDFWREVATTFKDDDGVILEPYNEPFPDGNRDTPEAWACWRDGCDVTQYGTEETYAAAGMQALVDAIRETGSRHVLLLGGVQYSNALSGWLEHVPDDPTGNLGVAWHVYNNNACRDINCWSSVPAELAAMYPVVATEIGQNDCSGETFLKPLMQFLDGHGQGYLAWSWNTVTGGGCEPVVSRTEQGNPWFLITDYVNPEPNSGYAQTFYDHLQGVVP